MTKRILVLGALCLLAQGFDDGMTWAGEAVSDPYELDRCPLPRAISTESLKLPSHLSFVQRGYIHELCLRVTYQDMDADREHTQIIIDKGCSLTATCPKCHETPEELEMLNRINNFDKQHVEARARLLRQAITAPSFNERRFWNAWRNELLRHNMETQALTDTLWASARQRANCLEAEQKNKAQ